MFSNVFLKLAELVNTYDMFKKFDDDLTVFGNLKILPRICSTSTEDDLFANEARMYANEQSQPSFNALTVIMYLISQFWSIKSTLTNSFNFESFVILIFKIIYLFIFIYLIYLFKYIIYN